MADIPTGKVWTLNELLASGDLNNKFADVRNAFNGSAVMTDKATTVTAEVTFSTSPKFNNEVTVPELTVEGDAAVDNNLSCSGDATITGAVEAASFKGDGSEITGITFPPLTLADVGGGTSPNETYTFTGPVVVSNGTTQSGGRSVLHRTTGTSESIDASNTNSHKVRFDAGTPIISISGMVPEQWLWLEVVMNGATSYSFGASVKWGAEGAPTVSTSTGSKDTYLIKNSGGDLLAYVVDLGHASTS